MDVVDPDGLRDLRRVLETLNKIDPWIDAVSGSQEPTGIWTPQERSPLSTDDRRTHPYRVSHRIWSALTAAVDFLDCFRRSLTQEISGDQIDVRLHSYAQMGLLRGTVENACTALWLLAPSREERITNRLRLEWHELKPAYRLRELTKASPPRTIEQRQDQLVELLLKAGLPSELPATAPRDERTKAARKTLRDFDYAGMVARAGEQMPSVGADLAEAIWRMCSALAHGDMSATLGLLGKEPVRETEPGITLMRVSAPVQLLYTATTVAFLLLARAFELLQERTRAPY